MAFNLLIFLISYIFFYGKVIKHHSEQATTLALFLQYMAREGLPDIETARKELAYTIRIMLNNVREKALDYEELDVAARFHEFH